MLAGVKLEKRWGRAATLVGLGLAGALAVGAYSLMPSLLVFLPRPLKDRPVEWLVGASALGYGLARLSGGGKVLAWRGRVEAGADALLGRWLAVGAGALAGTLFLGWFPQYLTWPWSRDTDTFAAIARGWDEGVRPYRDVLAYNFPGHTYLHWLIGKLAGWGRVAVFNAIDGLTLVALGLALVGWSRRRLGGALPGLVGLLAFLWHYLGYTFDIVAQRDWHAALLAALALLVAQGMRGWEGPVGSAVLLAVGLTVRPQVVLFVPAILWAVAEVAGHEGRHRGRAVGEWSLAAGLATAAGFAPLWANGLLGEFVRSLRIASYGGPYSQATPAGMLDAFGKPLREAWFDLSLISIGATGLLAPPTVRRVARPWVLAVGGALVYAAISPVQHDYLCHPRNLFVAVALALPTAWLVGATRLASPFRVLAVALLVYEAVPGLPRFWRPYESLAAPAFLARGGHSPWTPSGAAQAFQGSDDPEYSASWVDYVRLLNYLRSFTFAETPVANLLNRYPYEPLNGPAGRPSPLRCESGICWMSWVAIDLDPTFAAALESSGQAVVVWDPSQTRVDPRLKLPRTFEAVRRLYEPSAKFGPVEVWRRKPSPADEPRIKASRWGGPD